MRWARALGAGCLATVLLLGAAACAEGGGPGGGEGREIGVVDPSLDPDAGIPPEDVRLTASEVAAGLRVVKDLAQTAASALGPNELELAPEDAVPLEGEVGPSWATVKVTVQETDPATHAALEEAFPALGAAVDAGDAAAARAAADRVAALVDAYLARFPSDEVTPEPRGDGSMPDFREPDYAEPDYAEPDATDRGLVEPDATGTATPAPS